MQAEMQSRPAEMQSKPADKLRIVLSHSNDAVLETCPRKFEFTYIFQKFPALEGKESDKSAANVGTAVHEAAQEWARAHFIDNENNEDALNRAYYVLALHWDYTNETHVRPLGAAARLLYLMSKDRFWDEWDLCEVDQFGPAIEVPFQIKHLSAAADALNVELITQGKLDLILRNKHTGEIRCVDFKTTSKARDTWEAEYRYSDQGPVYSFPLNAIENKPIGSELKVTYYMLSFSKVEQVPGDPNSTDLTVQASTFNYDAELLTEMWEVKHERIQRILRYLKNDKWPRTTHGCVTWNSTCRYFNVCHVRDKKQLARWFEFENWKTKTREYKPVWVFEETI